MPNQPIRCFDGNAKPYEPFWTVRNAAQTGGDPEIEFSGFISEFLMMGDEITPKKFKDDLQKAGNGGPVTIRVNSPGGDVVAASVIRAIITDYPGDVTVRIDGVAASAAVIVAMAGKTVKIMDTAYMMIHDPAVMVFMAALDIETLGVLRDQLQSIKNGIVDTYASKTGISQQKLERMMKDETWMSANEALNYGFVDEVIKGGQAQNAMKPMFINALKNYMNVPRALLQESSPAQPDVVDEERAQQARRLAAHAKQFLTKE